ncbi:MAG: N-acetylmuramoyl-L-alanine amidase family protein [Chloroflexota bacterium]
MWRWAFGRGTTKGAATFCFAIVVVMALSSLWRGPADFRAGESAPLAAVEPTAVQEQTVDAVPTQAQIAEEASPPAEQPAAAVELAVTDKPVAHEAAAGPEVVGVPQADVAPAADVVPEAEVAPAPTVAPQAPVAPEKSVASSATKQNRVGIQAGHWKSAELPAELASLRNNTGTSGGGVGEWQLNRDVAHKVAALLEAEGVIVDVLPATVPAGYKADAFVALHGDGSASSALSGFKLARSRSSALPEADDALIAAITKEYGAATKLRLDAEHITRNMTGYYGFSNRRIKHATSPTTPAVILEMGFMTNRSDLNLLLNNQDTVAKGIAQGVLRFLAAD